MTQFTVRNPDFESLVTGSFARQGFMAPRRRTHGDAYAVHDRKQTHCATVTTTMIRVDLSI